MADLSDWPAVYIISESDDVQKIGKANDPFKRLAALQGGQHKELRLYAFARTPAPFQTERAIHFMLREKRLRGEWFACSRKEAADALHYCGSTWLTGLAMRFVPGDLVRPLWKHTGLPMDRMYVAMGRHAKASDYYYLQHVRHPVRCDEFEVVQSSPDASRGVQAAREFARDQWEANRKRMSRWLGVEHPTGRSDRWYIAPSHPEMTANSAWPRKTPRL